MAVRTVYSFNMQQSAFQKFSGRLVEPLKAGIFQAWAQGFTLGEPLDLSAAAPLVRSAPDDTLTMDPDLPGLLYFCIFCTYAVCMAFGSVQVSKGVYTGGDVMNVIFAIVYVSPSFAGWLCPCSLVLFAGSAGQVQPAQHPSSRQDRWLLAGTGGSEPHLLPQRPGGGGARVPCAGPPAADRQQLGRGPDGADHRQDRAREGHVHLPCTAGRPSL